MEIPLKIYGRRGETLRYQIKGGPAHGKLSELKAVNSETWSVTYEPPADLNVTADRFIFAVQNSAGVSAPAEVTVAIVDQEPRLIIPDALEYPTILVGETAVRQIEIFNRGGGLAKGEIIVPAPWKLEGEAKYALGAEESANFRIIFAPAQAGGDRGEIRFTSHPEIVTVIRGTAELPLSVEPLRVILQHEPGNGVRNGNLVLINRTSQTRVFQIATDPRLKVAPSVEVPGGGRIDVPVSIPATDVAPFNGELKVESPGLSVAVLVQADKVAAILRLPQTQFSFGLADAAFGKQIPCEIENTGGTPTQVTVEISAPFAVNPMNFDLRAGEKKSLALLLLKGDPGRFRTRLTFRAGPVSAEAEVDGELAKGINMPGGRRADTRAPQSTLPRVREIEPTAWKPDLNLAKLIRVVSVTPTSAQIEWPTELTPATAFRLERAMMTRDTSGELRTAWVEVAKVAITRESTRYLADVSDLSPQQSQTMRVVPMVDGQPRKALFTLDFFTPPKRVSGFKPGLIHYLLIALALVGGFAYWQRRRNQAPAFDPTKTQRLR